MSFAVTCGGLRLVGCDTTQPGQDGGALSAEQVSWLNETLGREPRTPTLLAMHHPPVLTGVRVMDAIALARRPRAAGGDAGSSPAGAGDHVRARAHDDEHLVRRSPIADLPEHQLNRAPGPAPAGRPSVHGERSAAWVCGAHARGRAACLACAGGGTDQRLIGFVRSAIRWRAVGITANRCHPATSVRRGGACPRLLSEENRAPCDATGDTNGRELLGP
jgi:hypothetical protein